MMQGEDVSITNIKGVGPELAKKFATLGVRSVQDLIENFPRRYDDYSQVATIKSLRPGPVTVQGVIKQIVGRYVRRGMHITEAVVSDATDSVRLVWFNQPYRETSMKPGQEYFVSGNYELAYRRFAIQNPTTELVSDFPVHTARIVPVYRETKGITSNQIRRVLREVVPSLRATPETLPPWLIKDQKLMPHADALFTMHFPEGAEALAEARRRLGFEEVLELTLAALLNKYELLQDTSIAIPFDETLAKEFVSNLPFRLTDAQRKVVW